MYAFVLTTYVIQSLAKLRTIPQEVWPDNRDPGKTLHHIGYHFCFVKSLVLLFCNSGRERYLPLCALGVQHEAMHLTHQGAQASK